MIRKLFSVTLCAFALLLLMGATSYARSGRAPGGPRGQPDRVGRE